MWSVDFFAGDSQIRRRALVADDDGDVCALLTLVLAPVCDVTAVHDAEAALRLLADGVLFDVIISDFMLPGISGLEFVQRVRCNQGSRTPILMISGHGQIVSDRARAAGADAFLDKPFTLSQLRATLSRLVQAGPVSNCA
jgi:CheY-like chemotaxis protein